MNQNELNEYIKHYLEKDKTQSAIMLSAPWGTGKSYYINNVLVPYLSKYGKKVIIVSLYGLKDIKEISKSIFFESKFKLANKNSAGINTGKIIAKTVIQGVASFFGVDLNVEEKDLEKLYSSIDLSDELIILEDVERTQIDILELLGFVNSLVERDSVKVLLVTNKDEILTYDETENGKKQEYDKKTKEYLKIKEKTIGDTILFNASTRDAIKNILSSFNNGKLNNIVCEHKGIIEIEDIMEKTNSFNLRSFIFGCQKTIDIFEQIDEELDDDFWKSIFYSNIDFCLKWQTDGTIKRDSKDEISNDLGTYKYPLWKFAYDYICSQYLDKEALVRSNKDFISYKKSDHIKNEMKPYFDTIYSYYISTEKDVIGAVNYLLGKLKSSNDIPFEEYGRLANYLIAIKDDLKCDDLVDECKKAMLSNIKEVSNEILDRIMFHSGIQLESQKAIDELNAFKRKLKNRIENNNKNEFDFDYTKDGIDSFVDFVYKNTDSFIGKHCFASKINNDKLIELIKKCNAYEISQIIGVFRSVYSFPEIKDFFADDLSSIIDLKEKIEKLKKEYGGFDKIQQKQLKYFSDNLNDLIKRLK